MVSKSMYPVSPPQQPEDFRPESGTGLALKDYYGPPPRTPATWLLATRPSQNDTLVVYGYLFDVHQATSQGRSDAGQALLKSMEQRRKGAHDFANDVVVFGGGSLAGGENLFVSNRTGNKEMWVMDYDGTNQRPVSAASTSSRRPGQYLLAYTASVPGVLRSTFWKRPVDAFAAS